MNSAAKIAATIEQNQNSTSPSLATMCLALGLLYDLLEGAPCAFLSLIGLSLASGF
jgi:hypothetical protein